MTVMTAQHAKAIGHGSDAGRTIGHAGRLLAAGIVAFSLACPSAQGEVEHWTSGGPGGGDIAAVALDPSAAEIVYAGTLSGVFKSADAGASWRATGLTGTAVAALAVDAIDVATVYAGTRDGVFKTADGGVTWAATGLRGVTIDTVVVDPNDSRTVYAGGFSAGVFKSRDGGTTWQPSTAGLPEPFYLQVLTLDPRQPSTVYAGGGDNEFPLRRSIDGGRTWHGVALPAGHCCVVDAVAIDPETPATVYVGAPPGVLKSVDGGESWDELGGQLAQARFVDLVIDPVRTTTLYALVEEPGPYGQGAVYKSTDAGLSWQPTGLRGLDFRELRALTVDRSGAALYASTNRALMKSSDGAVSWAPTALPGGAVSDVAIDPSRPARLYAATVIGVFRSDDRGVSWTMSGLHDPTWRLVVDQITPDTLYALVQGAIVKSVDAGTTWAPVDGGIADAYALVIDPTDSQVLYAVTVAGVLKSTDAAAHWVRMNDGITYPLDSLAIAPSDPQTLYGGTYREGVFATHDGAESWRQVLGYGRVDGVIVDPTDGNTVYADYHGGMKSTDGGQTWTDAAFPLAIDPTDPDTLYARWNKSTDGGATFSPLPALPLDEIYSYVSRMVVDPTAPTRLYAATYAGVYSLDQDAGAASPTATANPTPTAPPPSFAHAGGGCSVDPRRSSAPMPAALLIPPVVLPLFWHRRARAV